MFEEPTMDNRARAEELRHHADRLKAELPTLSGSDREQAERTLQYLSDVLLAIATGNEGAKDALEREGEAAMELLDPRSPRLN